MNLQQELAALRARIDELEAQAKTEATDSWPKNGDKYYYLASDATVGCFVFDGTKFDIDAVAIGNVFRTEEEAEREVERRKVLTELRKLAKASWNKEPVNYAYYSLRLLSGVIDICAYSYRRNELGVVYFATEKDAEAAIEAIGADRLMLLLED